MAAEDIEPTGAAAAEPAVPAEATAGATKPAEATGAATAGDANPATADMPISEAVKHIGGSKAGSMTVSEQPTATKAIDAVPVGPDPAAAATATGPTSTGTAGAGTTGTGATASGGAGVTGGGNASAAAATAAIGSGNGETDDGNTDGDYYLDAALADSNMGDEEAKPANQVPATTGTTDATRTGFMAPPASEQAAEPTAATAGEP